MTTEAAIGPPTVDFRDRFAAPLRGFGVLGVAAFVLIFAGALVFMPIAAILILLWVWLSKTPWRDVGLSRPKSWVGGLLVGILLGIGLKFAMKAVVLPYLGAPPVNATFHYIAGNPAEALGFAVYAIFGAGFAEELFFRGYLFERSAKLFGTGALATALTVIIVTAFFAAAHWQQGWFGMVNAGFTGLAVAFVFLVCRRKLFVPIVMHAAFDLTALWMIYNDLEPKIAHLVFH